MTCRNTALPEQGWCGRQFRPFARATVAFVVILGVMAMIALHYRVHLSWRYEASRLGLTDVRAIPDRPMPDSPMPADWLPCRVGRIEFSLPPELAGNRVAPENGAPIAIFYFGPRTVYVHFPEGTSDVSDLLKTASELCPTSPRFTLPRLRLACYQAGADDFRWAMTRDEVWWLAFRITTGKLVRLGSGGHIESFFRQDLDGIIHFDGKRAQFDWQSNYYPLGGYMNFIDRGDKVDPAWIRAVCQSLKVSDGAKG